MRFLSHIACIGVLLAVFLGVPMRLGNVDAAALLAGSPDLVSSATTIQDAPSGSYTILINRTLHTDAEVLAYWVDFFEGKDIPVLFEDLSCVTLAGDTAGIDMAESLASRLPANQMKVRTEDAALALSKAEAGRFDVLVMSDEAAANNDLAALMAKDEVEVVHR